MRTTLRIDDELYRRAKAAAAPVPDLPVSRETGGPLPGIDLHDARALAAVLDEGRGLDALR